MESINKRKMSECITVMRILGGNVNENCYKIVFLTNHSAKHYIIQVCKLRNPTPWLYL